MTPNCFPQPNKYRGTEKRRIRFFIPNPLKCAQKCSKKHVKTKNKDRKGILLFYELP
jgi:hypothetical protein